MKKASIIIFAVIAVLITAAAATSFAGITRWYGEAEFTVLKGVGSAYPDSDTGKSARLIINCGTDGEAGDELLDKTAEIFAARIARRNFSYDYMRVDHGSGTIRIDIALTENVRDYEIRNLGKMLTEPGVVEIREGDEKDRDGRPAGVTAENVVITGDYVQGATSGTETSTGRNALNIQFNDEGALILAEKSAALAGKPMSLWLDGKFVTSWVVGEKITNGRLLLVSEAFTKRSASEYAALINAEELPLKAEVFSTTVMNTAPNGNGNIYLMSAAGIAAAAGCLALIALYRFEGFIASLCVLLQAALVCASVTGYINVFPTRQLGFSGTCAAVLTILLTFAAVAGRCQHIKDNFRSGSRSFDGQVLSPFKTASGAYADLAVTAALTALTMLGLGGPGTIPGRIFASVAKALGISGTIPFFAFAYILCCGSLFLLLTSTAVMRGLTWLAVQFPPLRNGKFFGGASRHEIH